MATAKLRAPTEAHGKTLAEAALRTRHGVTIVGVKRSGRDFTHALPSTVVEPGDELIVFGTTGRVEEFATEACTWPLGEV